MLGPLLAALVGARARPPRSACWRACSARRAGRRDRVDDGQDLVRLATVVLGSALAVWIAVLRERLHATAALLDVIFERAPIGLALMDTDLRYVRVNQRLAEINGIAARRAHRHARSPSCCPTSRRRSTPTWRAWPRPASR